MNEVLAADAPLIGRRGEVAALTAVVERVRAGERAALVLQGEAGIGKTSLLTSLRRQALDLGPDRGSGRGSRFEVRAITSIEAEQPIALSGLVALLGPDAATTPGLGPLHARTLRAALVDGTFDNPVRLGVAVLDLLARRARSRPQLLVLDDAHWLDEVSGSALRFAFRRLDDEPVGLLAAVRPRAPHPFADLPALELDGLDDDACRDLLADADLAEPVLAAVQRACGGNPLALRELVRSLTTDQRAGIAPLDDPLVFGSRLRAALDQRIGALAPATRRALLVTAVAGHVDGAVLARALRSLDLDPAHLDEAEASGILTRVGANVDFTHPLLRHAATAHATPATRRAAHRALAAAIPEHVLDRRAWHLAEACEGADAEAVAALDLVARRAAEAGSMVVAAQAWERAALLCDDPHERARRLGEAGGALWFAQQTRPATAVLQRAWRESPPNERRAPVSKALGWVVAWSASAAEGIGIMTADVPLVADSDPAAALDLLMSASTIAGLACRVPQAIDLAERAAALASDLDDEGLRFATRGIVTHSHLLAGGDRRASTAGLDEFALLEPAVRPDAPVAVADLAQLLGCDLMVCERWGAARRVLERVAATGRARSWAGVMFFAMGLRAEVLWRIGRWSEARAEALPEVQFHAAADQVRGGIANATLARTEAALGLYDSASEQADLAVEQGEATGMDVLWCSGRHAQGLLALAQGRPDDAVGHLWAVWETMQRGGMHEPGVLWYHGDLIEALLEVRRRDDAERVVRHLDAQAQATGRDWARAIAARGEGLLRQDATSLARSVDVLDALGAPFEAARSRLHLAELTGDDAVRARALDAFESLGACAWIDRTRALPTAGDRAPAAPALAALLSPAELRVALAVGRGLTNRETADSLALSPRTVDAHLRTIYRKLGVDSRTKLSLLVRDLP